MEQLGNRSLDARWLHRMQIAAIGPSTAAELKLWSLQADVVSETSRAEVLAEALTPLVAGKRCLWPAADRARETLSSLLTSAGAVVQQVVAYRHTDTPISKELQQTFCQPPLDWIGISSPAIARQSAALFPELTSGECPTRIVSISKLTSETALEVGLTVHTEAIDTSWQGMLDAIAAAERGND